MPPCFAHMYATGSTEYYLQQPVIFYYQEKPLFKLKLYAIWITYIVYMYVPF